jgi:hypothetical protein
MGTAQAVPVVLDFGTSWPELGDPVYSDPLSQYSRLVAYETGTHSNEDSIAEFLNRGLGCATFDAADVFKDDNPIELEGPDGYFEAPSGWNYLVVQYDGPHGGSVLLDLGGNAARVPFDSAMIWGFGDKYAVSHYSLASPADVPDGGPTLSLIGLALGGLAAYGRLTRK